MRSWFSFMLCSLSGSPDDRIGSPEAWGPPLPSFVSFFRPLSCFLTSGNSMHRRFLLIQILQKSPRDFGGNVNFFPAPCIFPGTLINY